MPQTRWEERRARGAAHSAGAGPESGSGFKRARGPARQGRPTLGLHRPLPSTTDTPSKARTHAPSLKPHSASPAIPTHKPSKRPTPKKTRRPTTASPSTWPTATPVTSSPFSTNSPTIFNHCLTDGGPALQSSACVLPFKLIANQKVLKFSTCAPSALLASINVSISSYPGSPPKDEAHNVSFCATVSVLSSKPEVIEAWGFCNCPPSISFPPASLPSKSPLILPTTSHPSTLQNAWQTTLTPAVSASPSSLQSPTMHMAPYAPLEQGSSVNPACSTTCFSLVGAGVAVLFWALLALIWFKPRHCLTKSFVAAAQPQGRDSPPASASNLTGLYSSGGRVSPRPQDFELELKPGSKSVFGPEEEGEMLAEA